MDSKKLEYLLDVESKGVITEVEQQELKAFRESLEGKIKAIKEAWSIIVNAVNKMVRWIMRASKRIMNHINEYVEYYKCRMKEAKRLNKIKMKTNKKRIRNKLDKRIKLVLS